MQGIQQEEKLEGLGTRNVLGTERRNRAWLFRVKGELSTDIVQGAELKDEGNMEGTKYKWIKQKREQRKTRAEHQMMSGEVRENGDRGRP